MKTNQKLQILSMLRNAPNRTVTCQEFEDQFLFHKASTRIGEIEKQKGHTIEYIKGETVMSGKYKLVYDAELDKPKFNYDHTGQSDFYLRENSVI